MHFTLLLNMYILLYRILKTLENQRENLPLTNILFGVNSPSTVESILNDSMYCFTFIKHFFNIVFIRRIKKKSSLSYFKCRHEYKS